MISKRELRTLKWQLLLVGGLFMGCIVLAILMAANRNYLETFIKEKYDTPYAELPSAAREAADQAAGGGIDEDVQAKLNRQDLRLVYEDWISRSDPERPRAPAAFVAINPRFFLDAAERTMICGNREQRQRSLEFFRLASAHEAFAREAEPRLERLQRWAAKRNWKELAEQIRSVIQQQTPAAKDNEA